MPGARSSEANLYVNCFVNLQYPELTWVDCGAISGHFMHRKRRTAEKKGAKWCAHNSHISIYVCMHEIKKSICAEVAACMNVYMCAVFYCIYICS